MILPNHMLDYRLTCILTNSYIAIAVTLSWKDTSTNTY